MSNGIQSIIDQALRGEDTGSYDVTIYWDSQDSGNEGPAYRVIDASGHEESGALDFRGWDSTTDDCDSQGYALTDYFAILGEYQGPDQCGIYPRLIAY